MLRVGVDVGGTNTDGVLIDVSRMAEPSRGILASFKSPTTTNVSEGIENVVRAVLKTAKCDARSVSSLTIGTTHFINAVLERDERRLKKVAVIRLCGPYTTKCPPFIDFPAHLRDIMDGHVGFVDGGLQIDGSEIMPLQEAQIVEQCRIIKSKGLKNIVLVGVFSTLDAEGLHEVRTREIVLRELGPTVNVVCSSEVGQIGLLERENASILNASILSFAQRTIRGFKRAMSRLDLTCPLYLTQNDGTLTSAAKAAKLPIRTFASGQTNSMRGASYLAGLNLRKDANRSIIVCDVGGTTTDVGVLLPSGFPRQAAAYIEVGGVRTSFTMPDLLSIGLGGGSRVRHDASTGRTTVGPDSVGYYITRDAKVFGGDVLTASDISVVLGRADIGDASKAKNSVSYEIAEAAQAAIKKKLEFVVDRMKTSPEDTIVLMVGGGSILAPDSLVGVGEILRPPFFGVANAVGAAMSKVSGEVDIIQILEGKDLSDVIEDCKKEAISRAISAGADPERLSIVDVQNLPVQYVTNQATRIIVKASGELSAKVAASLDVDDIDMIAEEEEEAEPPKVVLASAKQDEVFDPVTYIPHVNLDMEWILSENDLDFLADGAYVMGCGGGGSPLPGCLICKRLIQNGKTIRVVDPEDVPEEALFTSCGFMGSPSVSNERMQGETELPTALRAIMKYLGISSIRGTISREMGGGNGLIQFVLAAEMGVVTIDADFRGRAYPNLDQTLPGAFNIPNGVYPAALADGVGNSLVVATAYQPKSVETLFRNVCTTMGSSAALVGAALTRNQCVEYGVIRSVSQAWRIGRAIAICRKQNNLKGIPDAIFDVQNGKRLFVGKIVDVQREVRAGFTWGQVTIAPLRDDEQDETSSSDLAYGRTDKLVIPFQNENIVVYLEKADGTREILVCVPDLIAVLDSQSGSSLGSQDYRYGLRVTVIALAADPKWTKTEKGMISGGPTRFGLDIPFVAVAEYREPMSVIREFGPRR